MHLQTTYIKIFTLAVYLLSLNSVFSQAIPVTYPKAGEAIIKQKNKDDSSKDTAIDVLSIKYYYEDANLIYYVTHKEQNVALIKIYKKQYQLNTYTKTYTLKDTAKDLNVGTFFMRKFLDSNYINKIIGDNKVVRTDITKQGKLYNKFSFTEKIDSINTDETAKMLLNALSKQDFIVDKNNGQMTWVYETFESEYITFYSEEQLISLKEQPVELIKNFINDKLTTVNNTYILKKEDILEDISTIKTDINPELVKDIKFLILNTKPLLLKTIPQEFTLIDFWFPGCVPCIKSIPEINKIQLNLQQTVKVIGVNSQKADIEFLLGFSKKHNITYAIANDNERKITELFGVHVFPTWILINKEGKIIDYSTGIEHDLYERIKNKISSIK